MPDQPPMPKIERITLPVCELCMKGDGEVCHVPGCVFCRHDVIKDLKHFAFPAGPPTFITTEKKLIDLCVSASKTGCGYIKFARTIVAQGRGRVIDVVALSMKCLAAVLNNEYMEEQLDGLQVAILNAIEGKENGE